jgi:hypothetical protein
MNMPALFVLPLCLCLLAGCEGDGMEIVDVFVHQRVRISKEQPPEGQVGQPYSYVITAKMENDPNDSDYDYHFKLVDGTIPPGTQFAERREKGDEQAEVAGVPTQTGQYSFAVSVETDISSDWFGDDPTDEAVYTITIR